MAEIGASDIPRLLVLNKSDQAPAEEIQAARRTERDAVVVSARTGDGCEELAAHMDRMIAFDPVVQAAFRLPVECGAEISLLHERGRVLNASYSERYCELEAEVPESIKTRLREYVL